MKTGIRNSSTLLFKFILTIILILISINLTAQDLDVNQTLEYLNKKFQAFPYQAGAYDKYIFSFSLTPQGELKIENKRYNRNYDGTYSFWWTTVYKIDIAKIDVEESFKKYRYDEKNDEIDIYGSYYVERIDDDGTSLEKRTVPAQTIYMASLLKNSIIIYLADASNKQNIKNALFHLYTLVISDPIKYGLNREADPFEKIPETKKADLITENPSNTIRIIKTESGLIEVPIVLNDVLRINFIFDSGASEVSLSPDVALTLIRTGTISESDWLESQTYIFADGSTAKSERFLIKKLIIGNQTLTNIEASISKSIDAPMLIGQNVMQKLGSITIDYENGLLIITPK